MPDGGLLTLRTDLVPPPEDKIIDSDLEPLVHLAITDNGLGMDESVCAHIFEPFFSTKEHGTGLGLAVVQQIVKEFGGCIEVWSKPNVGTRMDIWFVQVKDDIS